MTIRHLCRRVVVTIHRQASVEDAARLMRSAHIGDIVIVDAADTRVPIGIVTDRDIVVNVVAQGLVPAQTLVQNIMSSPALTLREDVGLLEALDKMSKCGVRRVLVVDLGGRLQDLISVDDIVPLLAHGLSSVGDLIKRGQATEIQKTENSYQDDYGAWQSAGSKPDLAAVVNVASDAALR